MATPLSAPLAPHGARRVRFAGPAEDCTDGPGPDQRSLDQAAPDLVPLDLDGLRRHRRLVVSIDGGGLYGLTSAIWLRQLAEREPRFLAPTPCDPDTSPPLLVGTSSGAINALLLAMHENPRDALLAGELEAFWQDRRIWSPGTPLDMVGSSLGVSPWFSTADFMAALRDHFGGRRVGELHHTVLISTYNWTGADDEERRWLTPGEAVRQALVEGDIAGLFTALADRSPPTRAGQASRHWRPKFFDNAHAGDPDLEVPVADLAYAAAAPPGFRALRGGLGDGASFNANPSVNAIAFLAGCFNHELHALYDRDPDRVLEILAALGQADRVDARDRRAVLHLAASLLLGLVLHNTSMVSIGSGQDLPHYGFSNAAFGFGLFSMVPTNPLHWIWPSPTFYSLDAATTDAEFIARQLLTNANFIRLNPDILPVPTLAAAMLARDPTWRALLVQGIYQATASPASQSAVEHTLHFVRRGFLGDSEEASRQGLRYL